MTLAAVMLINICGCGNKDEQKGTTKTVKEEVLVPDNKTETRVIGQRIVGVNKVLREDGSYSDDENINSDEENNASDDITSDENVNRPLTDNLIEDNTFAYRVVRANESTDVVTTKTAQLVKDIKGKLGCTVTYKTDFVKEQENQRELIIGMSNRSASAEAEKKLRANRAKCFYDAIICTVGKNMCIFAYNVEALNVALDKFLSVFCDGSIKKIPKNYTWIYTADKTFKSIKFGNDDITKFRIVIPSNPSSLILGISDLLQSTVESEAGYPIDIVYDSSQAVANEIHIGETSRNINSPTGKYISRLQEGKLYFSSGNEETLLHIMFEFCSNITSSDGIYSLSSNYIKSGTTESVRKEWAGYKLVWYDEFEGTTLNTDNWYATITGRSSFNGGKINMTADEKNLYVSDGYLHSVGYQENVKDFSCSEAWTKNKMYFRYGYLEARYKQAPGNSFAVFWLNSDIEAGQKGELRPEIDIVETFSKAKSFFVNLHHWGTDGDKTIHRNFSPAIDSNPDIDASREWVAPGDSLLSDEFHIYACEWTPEFISFYIDGQLVVKWDISSSDYDAFRNHPVFVQIGHMIGATSNAVYNPADMLIDYVRLYQRDDRESGYESFVSNGKRPGEDGYEDRSMSN